ncbi:phytoene/squalene synthase family protein [Hoyosella rhizosphaerae]|uniref:Phytoene synthase n=1 Tax=Hoyosella rhizosphaerae TaxID=1755582 RepID=A0A916UEY6_9ACTN|nr:phytoene/squalene synthase family protein [Hoyosella rhizosphaerae]MBN4927934.1 phytoene/squalene synthase family protein [Hoyosella rhizosphaerae]GGC71099.1 phytoene synthase [Hoyosella rhizosphaerae]
MTAQLQHAYELCRRITAHHARTYYLSTQVLDPAQRPGIYALYGFARQVDDVIDEGDHDPEVQAAYVDSVELELRQALNGEAAPTDPIILALCDTISTYSIPLEYFWRFLDSMRMDIPGTPAFRDRYHSIAQLHEYMYGSAAVIGLQLLPVFGAHSADAIEGAAALGDAFQLTNFLRDIADDYRRDRIYLPLDDFAAFGVTEDTIAHCVDTRRTDQRVRRALAHFVALTRSYYRTAEKALPLLPPQPRLCVETALLLYGGILAEIENADYEVFASRVAVPKRRRFMVAAPRMARAAALRIESSRVQQSSG